MSNLVALPDAVLWTSRAWTEFAQLRAPEKHVAVLPLFGFADWGLGRPLDLEETLGTAVLRRAVGVPGAKRLPWLILPPLRWVLGPYPHCLFGLDWETAHAMLHELAASVHAAGLRKLVLFNTSPWNEELVDAGGRDVRVALGLQVFVINLAALDLDLHPVRALSRVGVQCAATAACGALPVPGATHAEISFADFRPGNVRQPGGVPFEQPFEEARAEGERLLDAAAGKLARLLDGIAARRKLPLDGRVPARRAPGTKRPKGTP